MSSINNNSKNNSKKSKKNKSSRNKHKMTQKTNKSSRTKMESRHNIHKISSTEFKKLNSLSPFELKDKLLDIASGNNPSLLLDAGRGNPNFFNNYVRRIFARLQIAVMQTTNKVNFLKDLNIYPNENEYNYETVLRKSASSWHSLDKEFLYSYIRYLKKLAKQNNENCNAILYDLFKSTIGCYYPVPPRIQPHLELVAREFLYELMTSKSSSKERKEEGFKMKPSDFDVFATEGAAAGILYVFNTLKENFLLNPGDSIGVITPIFSPYLEMPKLNNYNLKIVELKGNPDNNFSLDDEEINKLKDKKIKALFMVNPANPGAYSLSRENIDKIGSIVNNERSDLIILSDNVYAPFANEYNSFMLTCPRNTIEVFSLSKYFGTTGWRLGLVMVAKENVFNKCLSGLPSRKKNLLEKRYEIATTDIKSLTFMDRLVFDSRQVAEAHVGGLSTPQQVLIGLFLFYELSDKTSLYNKEIKDLLEDRLKLLFSDIKMNVNQDPKATNYYVLLYIPKITEDLYGKEARNYLEHNYKYLDFLFHLAKKYHIVFLPGSGFGSNPWRVRICLANLKNPEYKIISKAIADCIMDFVKPVM
jgi:aspartate 4-decarboxylase